VDLGEWQGHSIVMQLPFTKRREGRKD
jgi:hypothetical protein